LAIYAAEKVFLLTIPRKIRGAFVFFCIFPYLFSLVDVRIKNRGVICFNKSLCKNRVRKSRENQKTIFLQNTLPIFPSKCTHKE